MSAPIPWRLTWAVETLQLRPGSRVLEVACGRGAALALLLERLPDGRVTGLDRSAGAIAAAAARNAQAIEAGRLRLMNAALADAKFRERFDVIFAVNVNVFWLKTEHEVARAREVLEPRGRLYLFYEPPSESQLERARVGCRANLEANGCAIDRGIETPDRALLCLVASPLNRKG